MFYLIAHSLQGKADVPTSEIETQTESDICCSKCSEPVDASLVAAKAKLNSGNLRVKKEFKLRIRNGSQDNDLDEPEDGLDDDDIDEDEERYAAVMAAAVEDSDDDDEGRLKILKRTCSRYLILFKRKSSCVLTCLINY